MTRAFLDLHHPRLLCECCELPTRVVPSYEVGILEYRATPKDCPLCEWENGDVDRHGETVDSDAAKAAERNGGHSLAEAQANFRRFLSMYDPAQPEPWMPDPPTEEEIHWKEELVRLYKRVLDPYSVDGADVVEQILGLEAALSEAEKVRVETAEVPIASDEADETNAPDDPAEPALEPPPSAPASGWMRKGERGIEFFSGTGPIGQIWPPVHDPDAAASAGPSDDATGQGRGTLPASPRANPDPA